jgi:hypothetical protein
VRLFLVPLLAAGFAFGLATAATELTNGPAPKSLPPTSIVWSGRVFSSTRELTIWLRARGMAYRTWAAVNPASASVLETKSTKVAGSQSSSTEQVDAVALGESTSRTLAIVALAASILGILVLLAASHAKSSQSARRRRVGARTRPRSRRGATGAAAPSFGARRGARTAATQRATKPRRPSGRSAPRMRANPKPLRRLRVGVPLLLTGDRERNTADARTAQYGSVVAREALRQLAPDLGFYVASGLLACVIGISIALYLN